MHLMNHVLRFFLVPHLYTRFCVSAFSYCDIFSSVHRVLWHGILSICVGGETPQLQCEWQTLVSSDIVSTCSGWLLETIK